MSLNVKRKEFHKTVFTGFISIALYVLWIIYIVIRFEKIFDPMEANYFTVTETLHKNVLQEIPFDETTKIALQLQRISTMEYLKYDSEMKKHFKIYAQTVTKKNGQYVSPDLAEKIELDICKEEEFHNEFGGRELFKKLDFVPNSIVCLDPSDDQLELTSSITSTDGKIVVIFIEKCTGNGCSSSSIVNDVMVSTWAVVSNIQVDAVSSSLPVVKSW